MAPVLYGKGSFTLYGTSACHLCEIAEDMLLALVDAGLQFDFEKVDIVESDGLYERYGIRIPVLRHPNGGELGWPFGPAEAAAFIQSPGV